MSEKETVEVTFRLPKRLLKILEEQNYFEWNKQHFFIAAVISFMSCNVNDMNYDKAEEVFRKYGKDFDVVHSEVKQLKTLV